MPKVSVGLPCYNGSRWIDECIQSILGQTYEDFELIIVDDGSTDNSRVIIEPYLADKRVKYIYQENRGFSNATNKHILESKGDYIAFIGQDDLWLPEKLERQINYLENRNFGLVHSDVYHINLKGEIIRRRKPNPPKTLLKKTVVKKLFLRNFICHQAVLVRKECFNKVGLFDERMTIASDHDMWIRIAGEFDVGYINEPLVKKRYHPDQLMATKPLEGVKDEFLIVKKAISKYPFLKKYESKKLSELYYHWGVILMREGEKREVKSKISKAIRYYPYNWKYYLIYSLPSLYELISRIYNKILRV